MSGHPHLDKISECGRTHLMPPAALSLNLGILIARSGTRPSEIEEFGNEEIRNYLDGLRVSCDIQIGLCTRFDTARALTAGPDTLPVLSQRPAAQTSHRDRARASFVLGERDSTHRAQLTASFASICGTCIDARADSPAPKKSEPCPPARERLQSLTCE